MPVSIEQHVDWITDCIAYCIETGCTSIEAQEQSAEIWTDHVRETADATLLPKVQHSWYLGANIPGKPRVFMPYAGGLNTYAKSVIILPKKDIRALFINSEKNRRNIKVTGFYVFRRCFVRGLGFTYRVERQQNHLATDYSHVHPRVRRF